MNLEHIRYAPLLTLWKAIEQLDLAYFESVQLPDDIRLVQNVSYGDDLKYHLLDIAYPSKQMERYPVIIQVHGGGWVYGTKDTIYKAYGMALAQQGFAVITINYRLAPTHTFPSQLLDLDQLMHFVRNNAKSLDLDEENVFMIGDSAGAHLISLFQCLRRKEGENPVSLTSDLQIRAVALSCGVYDFDSFNTPKIRFPQKTNTLRSLFGLYDYKSHPLYSVASVTGKIDKNFPDALVISSQYDPLYPQTKEFLDVLKQQNIRFETFIADRKRRLPHVFNTRLTYPESIEVLRKIGEFFQARIRQ